MNFATIEAKALLEELNEAGSDDDLVSIVELYLLEWYENGYTEGECSVLGSLK